jgi:hypothetical protein
MWNGDDVVKDISKGGARASCMLSLVARVVYDSCALKVGVEARTSSSIDKSISDLSVATPEITLFSF